MTTETATTETTPTATTTEGTPSAETPSLLGTDAPAAETPSAAEAKPGTEGETKPKVEEPAEVKYEFKPKEGVEFDPPSLDKFTALAKELKLSPEGAQQIVDLASEMELAHATAHAETVKGWLNEVKADKELGGDKLAENLAVARKTFSLLPEAQAKELKGLLNQTGLEAHPAFFRLFHAVGKALSEDSFVPGGKQPPAAKSMAERLYGNTPQTQAA